MVCECKGSEDGNKLLVTASSDGNIQVWSVNPYDAKPVSTCRWAYRHVRGRPSLSSFSLMIISII